MSSQQQAHSAFSFEMTSAANINPCFCFHSCSQRRRRQCELKGNTKRNPRSRPCLHLNIQNPWCSIPRTSTSMIFPAQTKSPIHRYRDCDSVKLSVTFGLCRVIYMTFSLSHLDWCVWVEQIHSGSSEAEEENDPDGCFAFRRKAGCQYYAVSDLCLHRCHSRLTDWLLWMIFFHQSNHNNFSFQHTLASQSSNAFHVILSFFQSRPDHCGNWPWVSPSEGGLGDSRFRYCLTSLNWPRRCIGLARRRLGRGGR